MKRYLSAMLLQGVVVVLSFAASGAGASVTVSSQPTKHMSCSAGVCSPTRKGAVLNVTDLASMLASGDVTLTSGSLAQDIEIKAALSWVSSSHLTLDAYSSLVFDKPVIVAGTGGLTITTNDGGSGGDFRFFGKGHVECWDRDNDLTINGQQYALVKSVRQITGEIHHSGFPLALARSFSAKKQTYDRSPIPLLQVGFEGLGNTISNVTITDSTFSDNVGFFGDFLPNDPAASIRDVNLVDANVTGTANEQSVGVLVGYSQGFVRYASVAGQVSATGPNSFVGGMAGINGIATEKSSSSASVFASNGATAGGLVGMHVSSCDRVCYGLIDQSYATGSVTVADAEMAGGLVGQNLGGPITNSYATGSVTGGNGAFVGGLIGSNLDNANGHSNPTIVSSYSTGSISGGSGADVGGLIGQDLAQTGTTNAYWDVDTSGINDLSRGAGNVANDPGIAGLTTAQFQSGLPAGFNASLWNEKNTINGGLPYLLSGFP